MTDSIFNYAPAIQTLARTITARFRSGETGFTIDWEGRDVKPRDAYVVGGVVPSLKFPGYTNTEEGTLKIAQWLGLNGPHSPYAPIGAWLDDDKSVYLDLVTVLPYTPQLGAGGTYSIAEELASHRGELAFGEFDEYGCYVQTHSLSNWGV